MVKKIDDFAREGNLTLGLLNEVGRQVVVGEFEEQPFPTEADLAVKYGVSRSVTREALKMLAAKGLVSARPKRGTFVRPPDDWNLFDPDVLRWLLERKFSVQLLRQFNELRVAVEPQAAKLAAQRARPVQVAAIANGLERMRAAEQNEDDALESDIEFHVAILNASGNPFFVQFRDVVETALRTSIRFTNRVAGRTASIEDHERVLSAIAAGDPDRAVTMMRNLLDDVLSLIDRLEADSA
ncbi:FadR/GntR family transcriptional regulator [Qipengyuania pelagi]|jgi:DNA-binding FadR family transcriptional regulator|uniref:FCD domain-containing protein n=1 Tax=Qipengyuania pelagi TaxID=994320 RepID=A0A844Y9E6_9SPHN|nr:FadR/GntR family transcriptional regulator [Qipengyuania pelagi]MXO54436.1 FCD domain-containing protein [Qipengyuania pelagi]